MPEQRDRVTLVIPQTPIQIEAAKKLAALMDFGKNGLDADRDLWLAPDAQSDSNTIVHLSDRAVQKLRPMEDDLFGSEVAFKLSLQNMRVVSDRGDGKSNAQLILPFTLEALKTGLKSVSTETSRA